MTAVEATPITKEEQKQAVDTSCRSGTCGKLHHLLRDLCDLLAWFRGVWH